MAGMLVVHGSAIIVPQWLGKLLTQDVNSFHGGTLKCLSIGTPKAIKFVFVSNGKLIVLGVPIFKHIIMML